VQLFFPANLRCRVHALSCGFEVCEPRGSTARPCCQTASVTLIILTYLISPCYLLNRRDEETLGEGIGSPEHLRRGDHPGAAVHPAPGGGVRRQGHGRRVPAGTIQRCGVFSVQRLYWWCSTSYQFDRCACEGTFYFTRTSKLNCLQQFSPLRNCLRRRFHCPYSQSLHHV
jgi:hypothetical protein